MPLSDREQQILAEMERNLHEEDPDLARGAVRTEQTVVHDTRGIKVGVAIFLVGIAALIVFFTSQMVVAGVVAFGAMVGGIVLAGSSIRSVIARSSEASKASGTGFFERYEEHIRRRYRRR